MVDRRKPSYCFQNFPGYNAGEWLGSSSDINFSIFQATILSSNETKMKRLRRIIVCQNPQIKLGCGPYAESAGTLVKPR